MSSFSPALLDCSRTVAAHVHLLGVCGTYPKRRQVPSGLKHASRLLQRFASQRVCPLVLILLERSTNIQVLFFPPLPAPRRLSESLNVPECLVFGVGWLGFFDCLGVGLGFFFPTTGLYLGRHPAGTVRGCREGGPGGSGTGRPPPPCPASAAGSGAGGEPRSNAGFKLYITFAT